MSRLDFCIICGQKFNDIVSPSKEHIIPEALGNKKLITWNVCKECNNKLGSNIDVYLTDFIITKMIRKGMLEKDKKMPIFSDTLIDEYGDKYRIRDDNIKILPSVVEMDENHIRVKASTMDEGLIFAKKMLKKKYKLKDAEIDKIINDPEKVNRNEPQYFETGVLSQNVILNIPKYKLAAMKIGYEYAIEKFGAEYYRDMDAAAIRCYLAKAINAKAFNDIEYKDIDYRCQVADALGKSLSDACNNIPMEMGNSLLRYMIWIVGDQGKQLICCVRILNSDVLTFSVLLSKDATKYLKNKTPIVTIITDKGDVIEE